LGEGLEHEGGKPQAARFVLLAKGGKAAVGMPVGQFPLISGRQKQLGLGLDLRLQLPGLFQILEDERIGGEEDHVLFATPERHLQQLVETLDGLGQQAAGHRHVSPVGVGHDPRPARERQMERAGLPGGQHDVLDRLPAHPLGLYDHAFEHGIGRFRTAGGHLDQLRPDGLGPDPELGAPDVSAGHGHGSRALFKELKPCGRLDLHLDLLRGVQVVVQGDLDGELLPADGGIRQIGL